MAGGGGLSGSPSDRRRPEDLDEADRPPAEDYCWVSAIRWDRLIGGDPRGIQGANGILEKARSDPNGKTNNLLFIT